MSWSRHGYENASYCISVTGRHPAMQSPIAVPRMPASASGVSTQRDSPKRSRRPAVARNTPPARPTSSPMTMTSSSRSSSTWKASLIASTMKSSAKPALPKVGRRRGVRVVEDQAWIGIGLRLGGGDSGTHELGRLVLDRGVELVSEDAEAAQVALVAADALVSLLFLDALEIDVGAGIVCRSVRRRAVGDSLDERRPAATPRTLDRLARRLEDREHVAAVDADPGHAVADSLVDERRRARLRGDGRRDRPLVVVTEEDERRLHHAREVRALVEGALARRAVAEEDDCARALALQLLPPGEAGGVGDLRRDRD